jgi:hypothetical protein
MMASGGAVDRPGGAAFEQPGVETPGTRATSYVPSPEGPAGLPGSRYSSSSGPRSIGSRRRWRIPSAIRAPAPRSLTAAHFPIRRFASAYDGPPYREAGRRTQRQTVASSRRFAAAGEKSSYREAACCGRRQAVVSLRGSVVGGDKPACAKAGRRKVTASRRRQR